MSFDIPFHFRSLKTQLGMWFNILEAAEAAEAAEVAVSWLDGLVTQYQVSSTCLAATHLNISHLNIWIERSNRGHCRPSYQLMSIILKSSQSLSAINAIILYDQFNSQFLPFHSNSRMQPPFLAFTSTLMRNSIIVFHCCIDTVLTAELFDSSTKYSNESSCLFHLLISFQVIKSIRFISNVHCGSDVVTTWASLTKTQIRKLAATLPSFNKNNLALQSWNLILSDSIWSTAVNG